MRTRLGFTRMLLVISGLCWITMAWIETKGLSNPQVAIAPYTRPLLIKGVIRYFTPAQERLDWLGWTGFMGTWVLEGVMHFS